MKPYPFNWQEFHAWKRREETKQAYRDLAKTWISFQMCALGIPAYERRIK